MRKLLFGAVLSIVTACGGGSSGPGGTGSASVSGQLRGQTLAPKDAISVTSTLQSGGATQGFGAVAISNASGLCSAAAANRDIKSTPFLILVLEEISGNSAVAPTGPGDFQVNGTAKVGTAIAFTNDAACSHIAQYDAVSVAGVIHLTGISSGAYSGTFDLQMQGNDGTTDHITGSFSASACPAAAAIILSQQGSVCG